MNITGNLARGVPKFTRHHSPGNWVRQALCAGLNPNLFFRDEHATTTYSEARSICARCPVTRECLTWALDTNTDHGIFGGLSPRERKRLQPERRRHAS